MSDRVDIVVTGTGAITALGFGVEVNVAALARDGTGIHAADGVFAACAPVEPPYLRCDVPAELESQIKFLNPSSQMGATAAVEAVASAGGFGDAPAQRRSLYLAQVDCADWDCREMQAGVAAAMDAPGEPLDAVRVNKSASRRTKPFLLLEGLKNNAFSFLATWFETRGPNTALGGFELAGLHAIDRAISVLRSRVTDVALVVGAAFTTEPLVRREAHDLGLDGLVPGDGAGALMLERRTDAERRGAPIQGAIEVAQAGDLPRFDAFAGIGSTSAAQEPLLVALGLATAPAGRFAVVSEGLGGQTGSLVLDHAEVSPDSKPLANTSPAGGTNEAASAT